MKVYILMYQENDYNQPEKAFGKLFWEVPTKEELVKACNFDFRYQGESCYEELLNGKRITLDCDYWIETFVKGEENE